MQFHTIFRLLPAAKPSTNAGKKCLYDPYRKKFVPATPEEFVRQKALCYFRWLLHVPADCIQVEVHMSRYGYTNNQDRADFILLRPDKRTVLAVVECKAMHVPITQEVRDQALRYAGYLNTEYAFVVNGLSLESYEFEKKGTYHLLSKPKSYKAMCSSHNNPVAQVKRLGQRASLDQLRDPQYIRQHYDEYIGRNTNPRLLFFAANLCDCLRDTRVKLSPASFSNFTLISDLGIRSKKVVTPGGGYFQNNNYRMFTINDPAGHTVHIGLSIAVYGDEKTMLAVYVEKNNISHHALQLEMDKNVLWMDQGGEGKYVITHTGRINIGRKGPAKTAEVLQYVQEKCPSLVQSDGKILLGQFSGSSLYTLTDRPFQDLFVRLISYTLILEEFRSWKKSQSAT